MNLDHKGKLVWSSFHGKCFFVWVHVFKDRRTFHVQEGLGLQQDCMSKLLFLEDQVPKPPHKVVPKSHESNEGRNEFEYGRVGCRECGKGSVHVEERDQEKGTPYTNSRSMS